jgi:glycosyltransferase involved in cell wall biosynthesis/SAM-dependent methyltransferase
MRDTQAWDYTFTVFTPTYNRAHTLPRAYASLCAQTLRDFEWLIVDDGSTDGTRALVEGWQREAWFPIRYIWKENGGKHTAHNLAVKEARGRFFVPLDSDDEGVPTALERFSAHWEGIPEQERSRYAFVTGLAMDARGNVIGDRFPASPFDSDPLEATYRYRIRGDKWGFVVTEIARQHPFPVPAQPTTHIPEGAVWTRIGLRYRGRYVNEPLLVVHRGHESLSNPTGSRAAVARRIAPGFTLYYAQALNEHGAYLPAAPSAFLRMAAHYVRFSLHQGRSYAAQWRDLHNRRARLLYLAGLPLGTALYARDRLGSAGGGTSHEGSPPAAQPAERFAFGENWRQFLDQVDAERIEQATASLQALLQRPSLEGLRFLDIGSGSGLFSLAARRLGAEVVSFDYDHQSVACTRELKRRYFPGDGHWRIEQGSVLDEPFLHALGTFDVVYSWGVLHHTGAMWEAVARSAACVRPGGLLAIALYNRHWMSPVWLRIKRLYNRSGRLVRAALVWGYYGVRAGARLLKGRQQFGVRRGMSLYHDVVDWVGGLPYEYASEQEVVRRLAALGFALVHTNRTHSTGCNEFLLIRAAPRPPASGDVSP